jgi:hypothetical protein
MEYRENNIFIKIKIIIGVSEVVEHACPCILFIVMGVCEHKIQNDLKRFLN